MWYLERMKVVEILRLKEMDMFNTYRDIAASVNCSKTMVGEILSRCRKLLRGRYVLPSIHPSAIRRYPLR